MDKRFVVDSSDNVKIEGFISEGDPSNPASEYAVILCHPYTLMGGHCDEPVTSLLFKHFSAFGFTTVKFNFRGAGKSTGHLSLRASGEQEDLRTIFKYVRALPNPPKKIILLGYSFGSMIASSIADEFPDVICLICIGYPYSLIWFLTFFNGKATIERASKCQKNKYFIIGDKDDFTSMKKFKQFIDTTDKENTIYTIVEGANHFWANKENELVKNIDEFLRNNVPELSTFITMESTLDKN